MEGMKGLEGESLVNGIRGCVRWLGADMIDKEEWMRLDTQALGGDVKVFIAIVMMLEEHHGDRDQVTLWALKHFVAAPSFFSSGECASVVAALVAQSWRCCADMLLKDVDTLVKLIPFIAASKSNGGETIANDIIPVWLGAIVSSRKSPHAGVLRTLPLLYKMTNETESTETLWRVISTTGLAGVDLLCRLSGALGVARWKLLINREATWKHIYSLFTSLKLSTPTVQQRKVLYVLREALEMCKNSEPFEMLPYMRWSSPDALQDWDGWLTLWEVLENHSLYLIEPAWPIFEKISLSRNVPKGWLQLLYARALNHDNIHVIRTVLVFLFQSKDDALWWIDEAFFFDHLFASMTVPALYRGISALVFPELLFSFWKHFMRDRPEFLARFAQELTPRNAKFRSNFTCVSVMLQVLAESHIPCLLGAPHLANAILTGRRFNVPALGWKLATNCMRVDMCSTWTAQSFLNDLAAHLGQLVFEHPQEARAFFAVSGALSRELPYDDAQQMACCVFSASTRGEARAVFEQSKTAEATLGWMVRSARGGIREVFDLLVGGEEGVSFSGQGPYTFSMRIQSTVATADKVATFRDAWRDSLVTPLRRGEFNVTTLSWARVLLDPVTVAVVGRAEVDAKELVPLLCSHHIVAVSDWELQELKWQCLTFLNQMHMLLAASEEAAIVGNHARELLQQCGEDLELDTLRWIFAACEAQWFVGGQDEALVVNLMKKQVDHIARTSHKSSTWREGTRALNQWANIAMNHAALAAPCMAALIETESQHERLVGLVVHALEHVLVPRWKEGRFFEASDAALLVSINRTHYHQPEGQDADHEMRRRVFARARSYVVALIASLPRGHPLAWRFVLELLQRAKTDREQLALAPKAVQTATRYASSPVHLGGVRCWQMACIGMTKMMAASTPTHALDQMADCLAVLLDDHILGSASVYLENLTASFLEFAPHHVARVMHRLSDFTTVRTSLLRLYAGVAHVLLVTRRFNHAPLTHALLEGLLPTLFAVQHGVRSRLLLLCHDLQRVPDLFARLDAGQRAVIESATKFYRGNPELRGKVERAELDWLPRFSGPPATLESVFVQLPSLMHEIVSELIPAALLNQALSLFGLPLLQESDTPLVPVLTTKNSEAMKQAGKELAKDLRDDSGESAFFQRKIIPWSLLQLDEAADRMQHVSGPLKSNKLPMVVCASLVERAPNLGGLTRTCEVFGLQSIAIHDKAVMESKDYTSLSRTAEQWIETLEVPSNSLVDWLMEMKSQGYSLIGLEQSNESVSIDKFSFPRKCVLLLGNENRGLPANLIVLLDHVIEIPQYGVIRSLNVHVSASILICSYALSQHAAVGSGEDLAMKK